ncbi:hypothetical protein Thermus77420_21960 [Thermus thalpophilus]
MEKPLRLENPRIPVAEEEVGPKEAQGGVPHPAAQANPPQKPRPQDQGGHEEEGGHGEAQGAVHRRQEEPLWAPQGKLAQEIADDVAEDHLHDGKPRKASTQGERSASPFSQGFTSFARKGV